MQFEEKSCMFGEKIRYFCRQIRYRYQDRCRDEKARVYLCFCNGGVQKTQTSRFAYSAYSAFYTYISYFAYSVYSTYYIYYDLIVFRMGGCLQSTIVYERRESGQFLYVVPVSSILGSASSCPGRRYWNDPLPDARGIS